MIIFSLMQTSGLRILTKLNMLNCLYNGNKTNALNDDITFSKHNTA